MIRFIKMIRSFCAVGLLVVVAGFSYGQATFEDPPHWNADGKDNFFENGNFNNLGDQAAPKGWDDVLAFGIGGAVFLNDSRGIQLKCSKDGDQTSVATSIELPEKAEFITLLTRMRGPRIKLGKKEKAGAGMVYSLIAKDGQRRQFPRVEPIYKYGSLGGWKTYRSTVRVLPGEQQLNIRAEIVDAEGEFEVEYVYAIASKPGYQGDPKQLQKLLIGVKEDDRNTVAKIIQKHPKLLEVRNGSMDNGTPLIWASWLNAKSVAEELIQAGADLEARDETWQNTPLAWCCWWGNLEVAKVLVKAGAKTENLVQMAASSKHNNRTPKGTPEDFDEIVKLIVEAKKTE